MSTASLVSPETHPHLYVGMPVSSHNTRNNYHQEGVGFKLTEEEMEGFEISDITFIIKTFERPYCLDECLNSIKKFYPESYIIVADDSKNPKSEHDMVDEYYSLDYDMGLSYGRNFLLKKVKTKYFFLIDDDTIFNKDSRIERLYNTLEKNEQIDIVAGTLYGNDFKGCFEKTGRTLKLNRGKSKGDVNGCPIYDFVINLFLARTDSFKDVSWDDDLKILEHTDFFWRYKDALVSTVEPAVKFINSAKRNEVYSKFRTGRKAKFEEMRLIKMNLDRIIS